METMLEWPEKKSQTVVSLEIPRETVCSEVARWILTPRAVDIAIAALVADVRIAPPCFLGAVSVVV